MPAPFQPPTKFADLIGDISEVARAFAVLSALQNLRVVVRLPNGALADIPVRISAGEAVIDLTALSLNLPAPAPFNNTIENAKDAAKNPKTGLDDGR